MSLDFVPPKNPYLDITLEPPHALFECSHESSDGAVVKAAYHKLRIGLGLGLCPVCAAKKTQEDLVARSVASALEDGLRPLSGTRAHVEAAEKIRADFIQVFRNQSNLAQDPAFSQEEQIDIQEILGAVHSEIEEQTEASWWMNAKHHDKPKLLFASLCESILLRLREMEGKDSTRFEQTTCGHKNDFYPLGPIQKKLCASCQMGVTQRIKDQTAAQKIAPSKPQNRLASGPPSVTEQVSANLPLLEGSEKQISWGEEIRDSFLALLYRMEKNGDRQTILRQACQTAIQHTKAKWWIEQANREHPDKLYQDLVRFIETGDAMPRADGLPEIKGTEKQVAWAEQIRAEFMAELDRQEKAETSEPRKKALAKVRKDVADNTNAGEWIAWRQYPVENINGSVDYYLTQP